MLNIIYGKAGTGKTTYIYNRIKELAESGKEVIFFVPDQFSFETEKIIYRTVDHKFYKNVKVTMFSKEAKRILRENGETKEYADDIVKDILMLKAINKVSADGGLEFYEKQAKKQGFAQFMLSVIGDLRNEGITPSALGGIISAETDFSETLLNKLNDIHLIYSEYDLSLTADFNDRLDDIRRAAELIASEKSVSGKYCFFDGFDNFSGSQLSFIFSVIENAEETGISVTTDAVGSDTVYFRHATDLISRLKDRAGDYTETLCNGNYRTNKKTAAVRAADVWQECDWICAEIRRLIDEGERFKDIAVLTPGKNYVEILSSAMKKYEIPAFTDIPVPLISKSLVKFPISALSALSFETDDILRYIKSGFVRGGNDKIISDINCDELEKLARKYGLRKKDWKKEFPKDLDTDGSFEALRKGIADPLLVLGKNLSEAEDGAGMTRALCEYICKSMDISRTIYGKCIERDEITGDTKVNSRKLDEYCSLWEDVLTVFESAERALRGYKLTVNEYINILTSIFTEVRVSKPPQVLDAVTVGDTERSRFYGIKTVFICGFNRGSIPKPSRVSEAFTGSEAEVLCAAGISVSTDRAKRYSRELFEVYRAVMLPSERLYLTCCEHSEKFALTEPSPYLYEIADAFGAKITYASDYGAEFYCRTEKSAQRYLSAIYTDKKRVSEKNAILKHSGRGYKAILDIASGEEWDEKRYYMERKNSEKLLSLSSYSPTALNTLYECRYKFYGKYGLGLRDDDERDISASLIGDFVHYCLFSLLSEYLGKRDDFIKLTDDELKEHIERYEKEYTEEKFFGDFGGTARFSYLLSRLTIPALKAAIRIRNELSDSKFFPKALEEELEFMFGDVKIKGRCDRRDSYNDGTAEYTRVIDYKHGEHKISVEEVRNGKDLQMLLYLFAICELTSAKPSSVMYTTVGRNTPPKSDGTDIVKAVNSAKIEEIQKHSPTGIYLTDSPDMEEITEKNNKYTEEYKKRLINMTEISETDYEELKEACKDYINAAVERVISGNILAAPVDESACKYCEFGAFCGKEVASDE